VEHLAQVELEVEVVAAVTIDLVEVVGATTVVVVITGLEEEVALTEMVLVVGEEEDTTEVVVMTVVLMITVVVEVAVMGDETRKTKGAVKVATMLVVMDKLLRKGLLPSVDPPVTTQRLRAPMEATMLMVQTLQCHLLIAIAVAQPHTHQAMVPLLQTNMVVVPQGGKGVCLLHMMVAMVVDPCQGVGVLVVHLHLIMVAVAVEAVVILVVLLLSQRQRLSSVMQTVMRHVTMQEFTSQICPLMSLLKNYRSYLEESARYSLILLDFLFIYFTRLLLSGICHSFPTELISSVILDNGKILSS
jgi:hypothetical protein